MNGIDVSEFQEQIDWNAVKAAGVEFAMIRASFGDDGGNVGLNGDAQFAANWAGAKAAGVARGAYHFAYPDKTPNPEAEADTFVRHVLAQGLEPGDVLALDLETGTGNLDDWEHRFNARVQAQVQVWPLDYSSSSFYGEHGLTFDGDSGCWVAQWSTDAPGSPDGWPFVAMWQNSNQGAVAGVSGRVDTDVFNGDVDQFHRYGYQGGSVTPAPAPPTPTPPTPATHDYVVVSGDTLSGIAQRFGVTVGALEAANPQISDPNLIFPAEIVHIPGSDAVPTPAPTARTYVVQSGDTLTAIAAQYGVSLSGLEAANPQISNPNMIFPGEVVTIPGGGAPAPAPAPAPTPARTYVVQSGDTLSGIADRFGVAGGWQALYAANQGVIGGDPNLIFPGQVLTIP